MRRNLAKLAITGALSVLALTALAQADTQVTGNLVTSVQANLSPKKLPREKGAPIAVSIDWKVATKDGTEPPNLKQLSIEINRNGILDSTGLPMCPYGEIQPASTQRALSNCRSSLVGQGSFAALVGLEGQEKYVAKGKMVVFNSQRGGKPVLFGQIYSSFPFAASFVIVFKVTKAKKGSFGTTLTATLPPRLRAWGNLTEIKMRLQRKFAYKGDQRSFLSASCPAPKGFSVVPFRLARTSFAFEGGTKVTSILTDDCKARG
jgi:hypothetical protein